MKLDLYQVDAFAGHIFEGNPAAVCPLEDWLSDRIMQQIAMENNLSETAFFVEEPRGYRLRWFTPEAEVDLCGHATLASAHVLYHHLDYREPSVIFLTHSGELTVTQKEKQEYAMNFPVSSFERESPPSGLYRSLGIKSAESNTEIHKADDYMLVLESEEKLRNVSPDFSELGKVDTRGVIITAPGNNVDFVSRFFAPAVGVNEDPVTGSAHCMLAPYWGQRLGRKELTARQISARGGDVQCRLLEDGRLELTGSAHTFMIGKISLPDQ